jgi:hypothetical protein
VSITADSHRARSGAHSNCLVDHERARAYCGLAHGQQWSLDPGDRLDAVVWLPAYDEHSIAYCLVREHNSGRPARDYLGNLLYMPTREGLIDV